MNIKEHFLGQSPLAILLQNETDDSLWFFINWVSSLSFCPTRGSRSFLKLQLTLLIVLSFPSIQRSYAQYNILTGQNSSALETERTNTQQRLQQQNLQIMMQNGYQPPAIPPSDPTLSHQFIVNQYNQNTQDSKQARQIKELQEILIEMKKNEVRNTSASSAVNNNSAQLQKYNKAFSAIKNMLDGKTPLSLKEAYFQVEQAYGNEYLSYNEYNTSIKQSVDFIKKWLLQNGRAKYTFRKIITASDSVPNGLANACDTKR